MKRQKLYISIAVMCAVLLLGEQADRQPGSRRGRGESIPHHPGST